MTSLRTGLYAQCAMRSLRIDSYAGGSLQTAARLAPIGAVLRYAPYLTTIYDRVVERLNTLPDEVEEGVSVNNC